MSDLIKWKTIPEDELVQIYSTYRRGYYEDDFRNYFKAVEARLKQLNEIVIEQPKEQGVLVRKGVADALEEVKAIILDEKIAVSYQSIDGYRSALLCTIRAIIKRNAEGVE